MTGDVEIEREALHHAKRVLDRALGCYRLSAEDARRQDTGVGDPCGRTHLRVAAEDAIGAALLRVRSEHEDGFAVSDELQSILDSFAALDASLGAGWNTDDVADLS